MHCGYLLENVQQAELNTAAATGDTSHGGILWKLNSRPVSSGHADLRQCAVSQSSGVSYSRTDRETVEGTQAVSRRSMSSNCQGSAKYQATNYGVEGEA